MNSKVYEIYEIKEICWFNWLCTCRYTRMTPERFEHLLSMVGPRIKKKDTKMREAIGPAERLTLTLRYLANGNDQQSLSFSYRIGKATVSKIIHETLTVIWSVLKDRYLRPPEKQADWLRISNEFETVWNLPHCVGAIDGKHIAMQCPRKSGSLYYNYKGFFSIVLMAVCDGNYNFTLVDIGQYGSNNDSGVLSNSEMGKAFEDGTINFPAAVHLPGCDQLPSLPYFIVGDKIFALKPWLMRPYPGRNISEERSIFYYPLSRARRVIENCFGILVARWRIFRSPIQASVETVVQITQAAVCLHNYLRQTEPAFYCPTGFVDSFDSSGNILLGEWRSITSADSNTSAMQDLQPPRRCRYANSALETREALKSYLNSDQGAVSWQWDYVRSRGPIR